MSLNDLLFICIIFLLAATTDTLAADRTPRACPRVRVVRPDWQFGEWSAWSPCSKTCGGGGLQHRRRQCADTNPGCQTADTRPCGQRPCEPGWSEWCEWEGCRATCGIGERMRVRFCEGGTLRCPGKDFQISRCNAGIPCPGWWDWTPWSQCSLSCGMGIQHRERNCVDERECRGDKTENRRCNDGPCTRYRIDHQWSIWSTWSNCDRPCGGGTSHRRRTCHSEREYCHGSDSESRRCNEFACHSPRPHNVFHPNHHCVWTTWSGWSGCAPLPNYDCRQGAGRGEKGRQRYCVREDVRQECAYECVGGSQAAQQRESCPLDPRADPCRRSG